MRGGTMIEQVDLEQVREAIDTYFKTGSATLMRQALAEGNSND